MKNKNNNEMHLTEAGDFGVVEGASRPRQWRRIAIRLLFGEAPHNKRMKPMLTSASKLAFFRTAYPPPLSNTVR